MNMETTDGHELKKGHYYYSRRGEQLLLKDWGQGLNGPIYIVSRMYEGEAIGAELLPNGHHEFSVPYEVDCDPEPVSEIFKDIPMFVVNEEYRKVSEKVLNLSRTTGLLEGLAAERRRSVAKSEREEAETRRHIDNLNGEAIRLAEENSQAKERLNSTITQISEAEDRLGSLNSLNDGDYPLISREELGYLRKAEFKLQCLEAGGVESWEWYDESLKDFGERYPD